MKPDRPSIADIAAKLAWSMDELVAVTGISRSLVYRMIARGDAIGAVIHFADAEGIPHGRVGELIEELESI